MAKETAVTVEVDGVVSDHFYVAALCTPYKTTYVGCKIKTIKEKRTPEGTEITIVMTYKERN